MSVIPGAWNPPEGEPRGKEWTLIWSPQENGEGLERIKKNSSLIRKILGERVRNQLRIVPELDFFLDDSAEYINEIEELLKK